MPPFPPDPQVSFDDVAKTVTISMEPTARDWDGYSVTYDAAQIIGVQHIIKNPDSPYNRFALMSLILKNKTFYPLGAYPLERANKIRDQIIHARMRTGVDDRERM